MNKYISVFILTISTLIAQIPAGYYDAASGLSGTALQQALHDIIDDHQQQSYGSLHDHYESTDAKQDGTVWDMYSDVPDGTPPYVYNFVSEDQCGNYSGEGDCYNREHSWPNSWFNGQFPMRSDLFHVIPSDGYVNGQRGSYPYGEVDSPNWTSLNGSKRGPCVYPGYSGTVFEPLDAYKGDFARIYFYMSTRYYNEDAGWSSTPMTNGAQMEAWALAMMLDWHNADPVSPKEIDRNNAIYAIQQNRNPFVDHPEYAAIVWDGASASPNPPSDLLASDITETSFVFSWSDNSDDEEGFYIYKDGAYHTTIGIDGEFLMVSDLVAGASYTFGVSAFNESGESSIVSLPVTTAGGGGETIHFVEDFETGGGSSYIDGDFTLESGTWNAYQAGNFTLGTPHGGDLCIAINDDRSGAQLTTPAVNTLGTISFFYYQRNGSSTDEFQLQKSIDGAGFETIDTQNYDVGESYTHYSFPVNETATSVRMRILNDDQSAHLIIDDVTLTSYDPVSVDKQDPELPQGLVMNPAYPNPFNPTTRISFHVNTVNTDLNLQVFNIQGELIHAKDLGNYSAGKFEINWPGQMDNLPQLSSGIYLLSLSDGTRSQFQRITLLR